MATNMPPHNLVEVVAAARHLIRHPRGDPRRPDALRPRSGPAHRRQDRRASTASARRTSRAAASSAPAPPRGSRTSPPGARASSSPSCPTTSAPSGSSRRSPTWSRPRSSRASPTSRTSPTAATACACVIEIKNGFHPEAVLEQLYRLTPMEESFGINNVALVDGQPRTLGLKELLQVYLDHRLEVVRRRSVYRRTRAEDRLHLVEGLLVAILDIDEVIQLIRSSDDAAQAARAPDERLRPHRHPDRPTSSTCRCAGSPSSPGSSWRRSATSWPATIDAPHRAPRGRGPAAQDRLRRAGRGGEDPRHAATHRAAGVGRPARTRHGDARWRWPTTRATCCCPRPACSPAPPTPSPLPDRGSQGRARRGRLRRSRTTARGEVGVVTSAGRVVRLAVIDLPALPRHRGRALARRWGTDQRVPRAGQGRAPARPVLPDRRHPRARAGHRAGRREARHHRLPHQPRLLRGHRAARRRPGGRSRRPRHRRRRTWSSSRPTPSCSASAPTPCARRAARPVAWPASASPPASGSSSSEPYRAMPACRRRHGRRVRPPRCPARSPARSR